MAKKIKAKRKTIRQPVRVTKERSDELTRNGFSYHLHSDVGLVGGGKTKTKLKSGKRKKK